MRQLVNSIFIISTLLFTVSGCGGGHEKATAPTTGKVTYEGQPVTGGTLQFNPIAKDPKIPPGKMGGANLASDGTFQISTYAENDGAVIGKGTLSFNSPPDVETSPMVVNPDGSHKPAVTAPSPFAGLKVEQPEIEIKSGSNQLDVKLVK